MKCAIYSRVSTVYQTDKVSLPVQRSETTAYMQMVVGCTDFEYFEDAGFSGKNTERPAFQEMMARVRKKEFSHVAVWKIDRISRNLLDFASMYSELKKYGVTFVSKNEQFDTSNAMGEAMLKLILVFAELERNITSERVTSVMLSKASSGEWNGGRIPYGYSYDKEKKEFSINSEEAETLKFAFEKYLEQKSLIKVCQELNARHITTKTGKEWSSCSLHKTLVNRFYKGEYIYGKTSEPKGGAHTAIKKDASEWIVIPNHHPAIIDDETFDLVTATLKSQRPNMVRTYNRVHVNIFAGLLKCSCGCNMQATQGKVQKSGYRPSTYACASKRTKRSCSSHFVSDPYLANFVLNYISNIIRAQNNFGSSTTLDTLERKLLRGHIFNDIKSIEPSGLSKTFVMLKENNYKNVSYAHENAFFSASPSSSDEISILNRERAKTARKLENIVDKLLEEDYNAETLKIIKTKQQNYEAEIAKIDARISELQSEVPVGISEKMLESAAYFYLNNSLFDERYIDYKKALQKEAFDLLVVRDFVINTVKKIVISDGKITEIEFKNGISHSFVYKEQ